MEFVLILRELAGRWRIVAIGAAVALVVAVFSVYRLDGFGLKPRSLVHSSASTQVLVDSSPRSSATSSSRSNRSPRGPPSTRTS